MKNKRLVILVSGMMLLSLLLAACSSPEETSFPTGKFVKSGEPSHGLLFNRDGTFSVFEGSTTLVKGTYSVDGNIYTEESNDAGCTDVPRSFKYTFDGINLKFSYVGNPQEDTCGDGGRRADFDNVTYTLSE